MGITYNILNCQVQILPSVAIPSIGRHLIPLIFGRQGPLASWCPITLNDHACHCFMCMVPFCLKLNRTPPDQPYRCAPLFSYRPSSGATGIMGLTLRSVPASCLKPVFSPVPLENRISSKPQKGADGVPWGPPVIDLRICPHSTLDASPWGAGQMILSMVERLTCLEGTEGWRSVGW